MRVHLLGDYYPAGDEYDLVYEVTGRLIPPAGIPIQVGAIVNNVETLTNVPLILANGADWYKSMGTSDSAGVKIFSLSGRVKKPGNYELPFGKTFRDLIYGEGGGIIDDRPIKAIMPAGASSSLITCRPMRRTRPTLRPRRR